MYTKYKAKSYKTDYSDPLSALVILLSPTSWCDAFLAFETAYWRWN